MPLKADYSPQVGIATGVGRRNGLYSVCPGGLAPRERSVCPRPPQEVSPRERSVYRRASRPRPSPSVRKLLQWDTRPGGNAAPSPYQRTIASYRFSNDSALDLLVHCGTIFPPRDGLATGSQRRWRADHRKFWRNGQGRYQVNVGVFSKWRGFRYGYKEPSSFGDAALSCLAPL